jgi:hypothetical protein
MARYVIKSPELPGGQYITKDVEYAPTFRQAAIVVARESGKDPAEMLKALKATGGVKQSELLSIEPAGQLFDPSEPVQPGKRGIPAGAAVVPAELPSRQAGKRALKRQSQLAAEFAAAAVPSAIVGGVKALSDITQDPLGAGRERLEEYLAPKPEAPDGMKGEGRSFAEALAEPIILTKEEQAAPFEAGAAAGMEAGETLGEAAVGDPIRLVTEPVEFFKESPVAAGVTGLTLAAPIIGAAARGAAKVPTVQAGFRAARLKKVLKEASPEARAELEGVLKMSADAKAAAKGSASKSAKVDRTAEAAEVEGFALNEAEIVGKRALFEDDFGRALGPMKDKVVVSDRALLDEALARKINEPDQALALVAVKAKRGEMLSAAEEVGINAAVGRLTKMADDAMAEAAQLNAVGNTADAAAAWSKAEAHVLDMDKLLAAGIDSGSDLGRAMRARRIILRDDMSIAGLRRKMAAVSDEPMTRQRWNAMKQVSDEGAEAKEEFEGAYAAFSEIDKRMVKAVKDGDRGMQDLLDAPWTRAADDYTDAVKNVQQAQRKANALVESAKPMWRKASDFALSALTERSLRASLDLSAMSTQAALSLFSHPMHGLMATAESFMMLTPKRAARLVLDPRTKKLPYFDRVRYGGMYRDQWAKSRSASGLRLYEVPGVPSVGGMVERELEYASSLFDQMSGWKGAPGKVARGIKGYVTDPSERLYAGFLNGLRMRMFDEYAKLVLGKSFFTSKGKLNKQQIQAMQPVANFVNAATGYGRLPFGLTQKTGGLLWSPRQLGATLEMSTGAPFWQAVGRLTTAKGNRKMLGRTTMALGMGMAQQTAVGMGILGGMKAGLGWDVDLSLRQSPGTWGKAFNPETGESFDPWSGRQQIARALVAMGTGGVFNSKGDFSRFGVSFGSSWGSFLADVIDPKLAPGLVRVTADAIKDQVYGGEVGQFKLWKALGETYLPISMQNMWELANADGDPGLAATLGTVGLLRANNYTIEQDVNAESEGGFNPVRILRGEDPEEGPLVRAWDSIDDIFQSATDALAKELE